MTWADIEDVTSRWIASVDRPPEAVISAYLADATALINAEVPDLEARAAADDTGALAERARLVCARMVLRVLSNPDQVRSVQDTTGLFSGMVTYATETLSGLVVTDADRRLLAATTTSTRRAFDIDLLA